MTFEKYSHPFVSVIIPTWRNSEVLNQCLESIADQDYPRESYEVILVSQKKPELQDLRIDIHHVSAGFSCTEGRNKGVAVARGEILAFLDDDCIVPKGWISSAVDFLRENNAGLVGGPAIPFDKENSFRRRLGGYLASSFFVTGFLGQRHQKLKVSRETNDYDLILANNFVQKTAFVEAGGFDEDQFPAEDYDLYYRLKKIGEKLFYVPQAFVWHRAKPVFMPWAKKTFYYASGRGVLIAKNFKTARLLFFLPSLFLVAIFSSILLTLFFRGASYLLIISLVLYAIWNLLNSIYIFFKNEKNPLVFLYSPLAVFLVHAAYGLGIAWGIYQFFSGKYKKNTNNLPLD